MKALRLPVIIAILLLLYSCSADTSISRIPVDIFSADIPYVRIEKVIPLETSENTLIGSFSSFAMMGNYVYILDENNAMSLFLFDISGSFLNRTKYGKAPSEMLRPYAFYVDTTTKEILVWDQDTHRMNHYDYELNFNSDTAIEMVVNCFKRLKNGSWLVKVDGNDYYGKNPKTYKEPYYHYFIYSHDFSTIQSMQLPFTDMEFQSIYLYDPILEGATPLLCAQIDNKLYTLNEEGIIEAKYQVDYGDYSIPKDVSTMSVGEIYAHQSKGDFVANTDRLNSTDGYLSFSFAYMMKVFYAIYSKQQNRSYLSSAIEGAHLLPHGEICAITPEGEFVLVADAADYVEFCEAKGQPTTVKPTDNPVLVMFTIDE